ncbi:hypothetical protein BpHYR1_027822, partial [Brachionus plicatilis]
WCKQRLNWTVNDFKWRVQFEGNFPKKVGIKCLIRKKNGTDRRQQTWNLKRPCKKGNLKLMINSRYHFNSKSTNTFEKNHKKSVYKF